jgi:hypothetical protein
MAQSAAPAMVAQIADADHSSGVSDDTETDVGLTRVDSAVLFYHEANGRVQTTEPVVGVTFNSEDGTALSIKLTSDTLTGATPNGAAPWKGLQTFITPAKAPGTSMSVTGASGGSTIVKIPGTGTVARQYTAAAGSLPMDYGFKDQRYAVDVGYSSAWDDQTHLSFGGSLSTERDYSSYSFNVAATRDFFRKNTTVSLALNEEFDQSKPYLGTPTGMTVMSADPKGQARTKTVTNVVAGVTQVMNRYWLAQLNYSAGSSDGYQSDPYRIISVVDPVTGGPVEYRYENRPTSRIRQSVYFGNKIALGPTYADLSFRAYHDSWGISSMTVEASDRIPILSWLYVEPQARYYDQSAANFFHNYLVSGQALPTNASSDSRLGKFSATTLGLKVGFKVGHSAEFYLLGENYKQSGKNIDRTAIGDLATESLFSGVNATSVMAGFTFAFR